MVLTVTLSEFSEEELDDFLLADPARAGSERSSSTAMKSPPPRWL